jgi:hypothetical protein
MCLSRYMVVAELCVIYLRADADAKQEELRVMVGYVISTKGMSRIIQNAERIPTAENGIGTSFRRPRRLSPLQARRSA